MSSNKEKVMQKMQADQALEINRFHALCHEVFFVNPKGAELLQMLERNNFFAPVAHPGKEASWAYFNEGRNDVIRSFRSGAQAYLQQHLREANPNTQQIKESA